MCIFSFFFNCLRISQFSNWGPKTYQQFQFSQPTKILLCPMHFLVIVIIVNKYQFIFQMYTYQQIFQRYVSNNLESKEFRRFYSCP